MKILHIGKYYPPYHGGMENYLSDLAHAQAQQGHQVTVWVHNHTWRMLCSSTAEASIDGVQVIRQKSIRPLLFTPIMLGFGKQLKRLINAHEFDLIHLHWPNPSLFFLLLKQSAKPIPWVISWHSDMVTEHSSWLMKLIYRMIKPLETRLIEQADSVLVSSQNYADYSPQLKKFANKTAVIPLGMQTAALQAVANQLNSAEWQDEQFRMFSLGRFTFYKNQQMLINAMPQLSGCQLLIAGNGQLHKQLQNRIKQLQLNQQAKLLTDQSWLQVHGLFSSCDLFCLASHDRAESFGMVLLEAMYHNKIILVPDTVGSGMQWLAMNYSKGFVFKANDEVDFVAKVKEIRQNYAEINARPVQFNYHISNIAASIEQHYQNILSGRLS